MSSVTPRVRSRPSIMFSATVSVGTSMKCWCTMPTPAAIASAVDQPVTSRPFTSMRPASGAYMPLEHAHERGLAGAVLADERVNLAARDLERRAAIREHGAERFVDVCEPDRRGGGARHGSADAHLVLGTVMRPAMMSVLSRSTRARTLSGMSARLCSSYT